MSLPLRLTSKDLATITPKQVLDDDGWPTGNTTPYAIKGTYRFGGSESFTDQNGDEFIAKTTFTYEMPSQGMPDYNDKIEILGKTHEIRGITVTSNGIISKVPTIKVAT